MIENLLGKVDALCIGGAMAYTFLKSRGVAVGKSLVEDDLLDKARELESRAAAAKVTLALPTDHVVAPKLEAGAPAEVLQVGDAAIGDRMGLDIGPDTTKAYAALVATAKTVVWNGPMGVFEIDAFATGTNAVAEAVASVKGTTIIGGGDSIAAVVKAGVADRISHISTGGGASLEFLGGQTLPGSRPCGQAISRRGAAAVDERRGLGRATPGADMTRAPFLAANWKMFKTVHEAVAYARSSGPSSRTSTTSRSSWRRRSRRSTPLPRLRATAPSASPARTSTGRRTGPSRGHQRRHAQGGRGRVRHRRPLRAPAAVRRHRRGRQPEDAGRAPGRAVPHRLRRRDARGTEGNQTLAVLDRQVKAGLDGLSAEQVSDLVLAYEPVWAIGGPA